MTRLMLVATIASLSIVTARFAWAQAAIQEPGAYAFYHPNGNVLHAGQYGLRAETYGAIGVRHAMASATAGRLARGHRHGRTH